MQGLCLKYAEAAPAASGESSQLGSPLGFTHVSHPTRSIASMSASNSRPAYLRSRFTAWRARLQRLMRLILKAIATRIQSVFWRGSTGSGW